MRLVMSLNESRFLEKYLSNLNSYKKYPPLIARIAVQRRIFYCFYECKQQKGVVKIK